MCVNVIVCNCDVVCKSYEFCVFEKSNYVCGVYIEESGCTTQMLSWR